MSLPPDAGAPRGAADPEGWAYRAACWIVPRQNPARVVYGLLTVGALMAAESGHHETYAELIVSARDARLLSRPPDRTLDPGEAAGKLRGGLPGVATKPTRTVVAGERIGSLEVIAAPGHTPGHIALLDTRDRSLICGDAFTTFGGVLETTARVGWRFPLATLATWDRPTELESARALRALEPSRLFVGHGKHLDDPVVAMDAAIARAAS